MSGSPQRCRARTTRPSPRRRPATPLTLNTSAPAARCAGEQDADVPACSLIVMRYAPVAAAGNDPHFQAPLCARRCCTLCTQRLLCKSSEQHLGTLQRLLEGYGPITRDRFERYTAHRRRQDRHHDIPSKTNAFERESFL